MRKELPPETRLELAGPVAPFLGNGAVRPGLGRRATGTRAISSRLRALLIAVSSGWQRPLAALEVLDQRDGVAARAQLVPGHRALPVLGHRAGLDRARIALLVELDAERKLVGQAPVQRHSPAA